MNIMLYELSRATKHSDTMISNLLWAFRLYFIHILFFYYPTNSFISKLVRLSRLIIFLTISVITSVFYNAACFHELQFLALELNSSHARGSRISLTVISLFPSNRQLLIAQNLSFQKLKTSTGCTLNCSEFSRTLSSVRLFSRV